GPDGTFLFSGDKSRTEPFYALEGSAAGAGGAVITEVRYAGAYGGPAAEVAELSYVPLGEAGSDLFWAEKQAAVSGADAREWRAANDSAIIVDGRRVEIKAGDNVHAVAARINDSGAAVKASIDPAAYSISLETTLPHQMRIEDEAGPTRVLAELGLVQANSSPPSNWAPGARVTGGSVFDVVIRLRDSLNRGDALEAGGAALAGIDAGLDNLNRRVTELGSRTERLGFARARLNREIPDATKLLSEESDVDVAQAITDYKMMEYAHAASLGLAGRLFPKTLLDFLE
ncbi:MAG: hypothetical protein Q8M76_01245, partial [Spirochaetaceae bacterium]|nr:hypothetical protein [Spirochaetaceae bacterium]